MRLGLPGWSTPFAPCPTSPPWSARFSPQGATQIARNGHIAYVRVQFDEQAGNLPTPAIKKVVSTAESFGTPAYRVAVGGQAIELVSGNAPGSSEGFGIFAAIIIMLLAFGSVVAMGLPIITALFGIAIGFAVLDLLSHVVTTPVFAPEIMAMIGLGVGIDYALFVVTRYRQGLAEGREPREAIALSLATSGRAVLFAGTTVILSLLGLFILQLSFMRGLAIGAIAAVVLVMTAAITLLPAMLGFSGRAIDKLHVPGLLQSAAQPSARGFWYRWSRTVQRHPLVAGFAALLVLLILAVPFFSMRLAFTDAGNDPPNLTTRQAFDALATGFGPGFNGPLIIAANVPPGQHAAIEQLDAALKRTAGVAFVAPAQFSTSGTAAVIIAYPTTSPQSAQTEAMVHNLRDHVIPAVDLGHRRQCLRGRRDGWIGRRLVLSFVATSLGHRYRPSPLLSLVDGRVPVIGHSYQSGHRQSAVGGRRLWGHRGGLPVGMAGWCDPDRGNRPDRSVDPSHDVHDLVRSFDGLRGVPPVKDARGVADHP